MKLTMLSEGHPVAHSVEFLHELRSIAMTGLNAGSSVEPFDRIIYAGGTIRIVFQDATGSSISRSFAPDMLFTRTWDSLPPESIIRVEVDVSNLVAPPPTMDEMAARYEQLEKEFNNKIPDTHRFWKELERAEDRWELQEKGESLDSVNWRQQVKKALEGTPAANVPIIKRNLSKLDKL